jgi:phosphate transport system permease protein
VARVAAGRRGLRRRASRRRLQEWLVRALLGACALISVLTTAGIVLVLIGETLAFLRQVSLAEFLTGTRWTPQFNNPAYGIWPLLNGTLLTAAGAMLVALPLGLLAAIYLSEYAPGRVRRTLKPALEILAGIPTVVYGYFALQFVTPLLRALFGAANVDIFNAASASLVMGIMILPMVSSMSEDAMAAVPRSLREAAYALGATPFEVAVRVVVPAALSGITAAFILAISRAIGETMIVAIAAGQQPRLTLNPLESIETMTAYIVQVSLGDTPQGTLQFQTIFAVAMVLFLMTLGLNLVSQAIARRFREVYA